MRRITTWLLSTITLVVLMFGYHTSTSSVLATQAEPAITSGRTAGSTSAASSAGSSTVTGAVAQTRWGPVQVKITVADGSVTQVSVVQYPSGNSQDEQINSYALPVLVQETMDAQSADIDMVSGATVTSVGYQQSLQSALDQAGL